MGKNVIINQYYCMRGVSRLRFFRRRRFIRQNFSGKNLGGFTLIELLVVVGITAILAVVVVMSLNPSQLLSQSRDGRRVAEITSLDRAVALAITQNPDISLGASNLIYLSLPNLTGTSNCGDYPTLPALIGSWQYSCAPSSTFRKVDGTGWIPINLTSLPMVPLDSLAIDPVNDAGRGLYYSYIPNYEFDSKMESSVYAYTGNKDVESRDGGDSLLLFEKGTNLRATPSEANYRLVYDVKVPQSCDDFNITAIPSPPNGFDRYTRWTIPGSGKVFITKIWLYQPDATLLASEYLEMAIYSDCATNNCTFNRLSEKVRVYGTGVAGWTSGLLSSPLQANLGLTYIFGVSDGIGTGNYALNLSADSGSNCNLPQPGYFPGYTIPTEYTWFLTSSSDGTLSDNLNTTFMSKVNNSHALIIGVSYAK